MNDNILSGEKDDLERSLDELPGAVANSLIEWRKATLNREKCEALLYLQYKGEDRRTTDEIKAMVKSDKDRYDYVLQEIRCEGLYIRLYEKLLASKRLAGLRTAF